MHQQDTPNEYYTNWENQGLVAPPKHPDVRNFAVSVGLAPMEDYLIDPKVPKLTLGLGWDEGVDVDASAALFSQDMHCLDLVWWHQLVSRCGNVKHSGDDRTGEGGGDDETIKIDLEDLPEHVHHILLAVCIYSEGFTFRYVRRAYVRMLHGKPKYNSHMLCSFDLSGMTGNAMLMGQLTRKGAYWNFRALGVPASGRTIQQLVIDQANLQCLAENPSFPPEFRSVTVQVIEGKNLAAKDAAGYFSKREPTSDPYYIIKFRKRHIKSEHVEKNLNPKWRPQTLNLGRITEAESKALKVEVFDFDLVSENEFMGCLWIPANALFNKGVGSHLQWFALGPSKDPKHRKENVSGEVLFHIIVSSS